VNELVIDPQMNVEKIDELELAMLEQGHFIELPVINTFTPGLYSREIFMPKGTLLTSKVHKTEHPYVILSGKAKVYKADGDFEELEAGFSGITQPNTRRVLYIEEDCKWVTFHPLSNEEESARVNGAEEEEILALIEDRIIEKALLPGTDKTVNDIYKSLLETQALTKGDTPCLGQ